MKKLFYIIILGCMYSCSSGEKHPDGIEDIFVSLEDKSLTTDKPAFETFDYVKLEMTSESVIGDVSKVVIGNERIYVLSLIDPRIFIFSLDGKYIKEKFFLSVILSIETIICMFLTTIEVLNSMTLMVII